MAIILKGSEVPQAPVSDASCRRVSDVTGADGASALADQLFNWKNNIFPGGSTLASYDGKGAQRAYQQLKDALSSCRSFD
jgi:hypothetical protein